MSAKTLSIIVPVYNMVADGKLARCMDSLVGQQLADYEIIAVDDKSTDDSLKVLREYEGRYPGKVRVIASDVNRKQGGAKNLGLDAALGGWIGFMDSDDWAAPDMYSKLLQKATETGADVVGCDYLVTDQVGGEGTAVQNNFPTQTGILDEEKYRALLLQPGSMVVKIYRRELFEENKIRFPEGIFYEDNAIGVIPLLYAKHFERVEECLYFYYQHGGSTVHTISKERCRNRMTAASIYENHCKERGFYGLFQEEIDYKVFELGYRHTLFSYMQTEKRPDYAFLKELQEFLQKETPDYAKNAYFKQFMDEENQKLIALHEKSPLVFLWYYRLLMSYREIRYGKR